MNVLPKLQKQFPTDLTTSAALIAYIAQTVGLLLLHGILAYLLAAGVYMTIDLAVVLESKVMTVAAVACGALALMGLAAVVIDVCNVVFVIKEIQGLKKP